MLKRKVALMSELEISVDPDQAAASKKPDARRFGVIELIGWGKFPHLTAHADAAGIYPVAHSRHCRCFEVVVRRATRRVDGLRVYSWLLHNWVYVSSNIAILANCVGREVDLSSKSTKACSSFDSCIRDGR